MLTDNEISQINSLVKNWRIALWPTRSEDEILKVLVEEITDQNSIRELITRMEKRLGKRA